MNWQSADREFYTDRGQGLNHCIADASRLIKDLSLVQAGSQPLHDAVNAYQAEMIERSGEEVKMSVMNTTVRSSPESHAGQQIDKIQMLHDWTKVMNSPLMQKSGSANVKRP